MASKEKEELKYTYRDREFVILDQNQQYIEELICPVCHGLVADPHQTTCGHLFCKDCFSTQPRWAQSCPICRQHTTTHSDNFTDRRLRNLRVRCTNQDQGCEWVGSLGEAMDHLESQNGCDYEEVGCTYGCGARRQRRIVREHELEECPYREYSCPYCGANSSYYNITSVHYNTCDNFPLKCPNNCKEETIPRALLEDHLDNECPKESVYCRYKSLGCEVVVERERLEKHTEASKDEHLRLAMEKVMELSYRMEEMETTTRGGCRTKLPSTHKDTEMLKQAVSNLESRVGNLEQQTGCQPHNNISYTRMACASKVKMAASKKSSKGRFEKR